MFALKKLKHQIKYKAVSLVFMTSILHFSEYVVFWMLFKNFSMYI